MNNNLLTNIATTQNALDINQTFLCATGLLIAILGYCLRAAYPEGIPGANVEDIIGYIVHLPIGLFDANSAYFGLQLAGIYLTIVNQLEYIPVSLNQLDISQINSMLLNLEGLIRMHEIVFAFFNRYTDIWDPSDIHYVDFNIVHQAWREAGNNLMNLYRFIEDYLNIPEEASRLALAWYED